MKLLVQLSLLIIFSACSWFPRHLHTKTGQVRRLCKTPVYYTLYGFDDELVEPVVDAADYWNIVLGKRIFIYSGRDPKRPKEWGPNVLAVRQVKYLSNSCGNAIIVTEQNTGCGNALIVNLRKMCMPDRYRTETLARHELGHVLGLKNSDNPAHLMNKSVLINHDLWVVDPVTEPVDACESEIEKLKEIY